MVERKVIIKEIRDVAILLVISFLITISGIWCRQCRDDFKLFFIVWSVTSVMWILLWKGNEYMAGYISTKISWIDYPGRRLIVGIITTIIYTVAAVQLCGFATELIFGMRFTSTLVTTTVITLVISLFMHSAAFLDNWRRTAIDVERYKKESLAAQYESLKNQVSPHFLFNSLNAVTNLIYDDKEKALIFIDRLSEVYRYVINTRDREVVDAGEEIAFTQSYLFLQSIRFGEKLRVTIDLPEVEGFVPPLALQMLVENAIKHNIVSEDDPLNISIRCSDNSLVVANNYQPRQGYNEPSSGVGLENIRRRYAALSERSIGVSQEMDQFVVRLPLLRREDMNARMQILEKI